jgi:hypothetical protein
MLIHNRKLELVSASSSPEVHEVEETSQALKQLQRSQDCSIFVVNFQKYKLPSSGDRKDTASAAKGAALLLEQLSPDQFGCIVIDEVYSV